MLVVVLGAGHGTEIPGLRYTRKMGTIPNTTLSPPERHLYTLKQTDLDFIHTSKF